VTTAVVTAAIPSNKGVIHSCYSNTNGALRVIDGSGACGSGETGLKWDQDGVKAYAHVTYSDETSTNTLDTTRDRNISAFSTYYDTVVDDQISCFSLKVPVKNVSAVTLVTAQEDLAASVDPAEFAAIGGGACPAGTDAVVSNDPGSFYVTFN